MKPSITRAALLMCCDSASLVTAFGALSGWPLLSSCCTWECGCYVSISSSFDINVEGFDLGHKASLSSVSAGEIGGIGSNRQGLLGGSRLFWGVNVWPCSSKQLCTYDTGPGEGGRSPVLLVSTCSFIDLITPSRGSASSA